MDVVFIRINEAIENQLSKLSMDEATRSIRRDNYLRNIPFFNNVMAKISLFALNKAKLQYQKVKLEAASPLENALPSCTDTFTSQMGIPCAHTMKRYMASNERLNIEDFDGQWHLFADLTRNNPVSRDIPLPEYATAESGFTEEERSDYNAMLEDQYHAEVFAAERRSEPVSVAEDINLQARPFSSSLDEELNDV